MTDEQWAQSCPACGVELATVELEGAKGKIRLGPKCSRLLTYFAYLVGEKLTRKPALTVVQ